MINKSSQKALNLATREAQRALGAILIAVLAFWVFLQRADDE